MTPGDRKRVEQIRWGLQNREQTPDTYTAIGWAVELRNILDRIDPPACQKMMNGCRCHMGAHGDDKHQAIGYDFETGLAFTISWRA